METGIGCAPRRYANPSARTHVCRLIIRTRVVKNAAPVATLSEYLELLESQAEALIETEDEAAASLTERVRKMVDAFTRDLVTRWTIIVGDALEATPDQARRIRGIVATFIEQIKAVLGGVDPAPIAEMALALGVANAAASGGLIGVPVAAAPIVAGRLPRSLRSLVNSVVPSAIRRANRVQLVADTATTLDDMRTVAGMAKAVTRSVEMGARTIVNAAHADGVDMVARKNGWETVWRPERDACLDCLALAGVMSRGGVFPKGRTYRANGKAYAVPKGALTGPPLHPSCRCGTAPWSVEWTSDLGSLPDALKREAQRSVILGFALESESDAARRKAAEKLLAADPALPKTVKSRARSAVRNRVPFATRIP